MKDKETISGVVYDYYEVDGDQSFKIRTPSSGEVVSVGFMDILFGDSEALKNDESIELTRLEGGRYRISSPKAELERMQLLVQKEKKNRIYY